MLETMEGGENEWLNVGIRCGRVTIFARLPTRIRVLGQLWAHKQ